MKTAAETLVLSEPVPPLQGKIGNEFFCFCQTNYGCTDVEVWSFLRCARIEQEVLAELIPEMINAAQAEGMGLATHLNGKFGAVAAMQLALKHSDLWRTVRGKMAPIFESWCIARDKEAARQKLEAEELADAQRAVVQAKETARLALLADPALKAAQSKVDAIAAARLKAATV